jgi:4-carboxymuconolactone decarboxylase
MSEPDDDRRARGAAKMAEVYSFPFAMPEVAEGFHAVTVDHLFGDIWTREALDVRDRRLLTIGVIAAVNKAGLLEIQFGSALARGELTVEQIREIPVHLAHYVGWPLATSVYEAAEKVIARHEAAQAEAASEGDGDGGGEP